MNLDRRWIALTLILSICSINPYYIPISPHNDIRTNYSPVTLESTLPNNYSIEAFRNTSSGGYYHAQEMDYYCGPACVQMLLDYLQFQPHPSQEILAVELNTDFYQFTMDVDMPTSFVNRGFEVNDSTHSNFNTGWATILESIHQNHPVIVLMWFSSLKRYGHYVVIIGYNQTGLFIHDPWLDSAVDRECGSNVYLSKYLFEILWEYDEYWSMIIPYQPGLTLKAEVDPEYTSLDIITLNVTAYNNGQRLMGSDVIAYATIWSNGHYILDFEEVLTLLDDGKGNYLGKYQIQHGDLNGLEEEWEIYINMIFDDFVGGIKTTTKVTYSPIPMIVIGCVIVIVLSVLVLSILWIRRRRIPYQN